MKKNRIKIRTFIQIIFCVLFAIAGIIIVFSVNYNMKEHAISEAESKARIILDQNISIHTYFSHQLKPNVFKYTEPLKRYNYFDPSWMSSTYAVKEIQKYFKKTNEMDYYYKECAINARDPRNEADEYEKNFIKKLNSDPKLIKKNDIRKIEKKPYFVVMRKGETMDESCLRCHDTPQRAPADLIKFYGPKRSFNREVNEVVSAISIRIPLAKAYSNADKYSFILSTILIILLIFLLAVLLVSNQVLLFSPLKRIEDYSTKIINDKDYLGKVIPLPFGKELYNFTSSFNSLSEQLKEILNELEKKVKKRTAELSDANISLKKEIEIRKRTEEELKVSLEEKDILFKEVHHRVKNNFQAIISLLNFELVENTDPKYKKMMQRPINRINTMVLIHDQLYRSDDIKKVDFSNFVKSITNEIISSYNFNKKDIHFIIDTEDIYLTLHQSIPCGLILNELLTNSIKYAFPDDFKDEAKIYISFTKLENDMIELKYNDNGIGLSKIVDKQEKNTMGLTLINVLTKQLRGDFEQYDPPKAAYRITFPKSKK